MQSLSEKLSNSGFLKGFFLEQTKKCTNVILDQFEAGKLPDSPFHSLLGSVANV